MRSGRIVVGHPVDVATGVVHSNYRDALISGRVDLVWERRYNASLRTRESALGPGWTTPYFAALTRDSEGFVFVTPESNIERFVDAGGTIERGAVIRNVGSFQELSFVGDRFAVTRWDVESGAVVRYLFAAGQPGAAWPLDAIEDSSGQGLDLQYDQAGRLQGVRQRLEKRSLALEYDHSGTRILTVYLLTADGRRHLLVRYEYDSRGRLAVVEDAIGATERYEYDNDSQITRESLKDGGVFQYRYDNRGRCIWTSGLDHYDEKVLRYYDAIRWTEVTDSIGSVTRYEWGATGQVTQVVDPAGSVWKTEYDDFGRIVCEVDGAGAVVRYTYDKAGNRSTTTDPLGNTYTRQFTDGHLPLAVIAPTGAAWRREYDAYNRVVATIDPLGGRWQTTYDVRGNPVEITAPTGNKRRQTFSPDGILVEATDWRGYPTRYTFDDFGRLSETVSHTGYAIRAEYDPRGKPLRLIHSDKTTIAFTYDVAGNLTRVIDANGNATHYHYGPYGRLLDRIDSLGATASLRWGTEPGRLDAVINELGQTYTFEYDTAGRVVRETGFDTRELRYEYDLAGRTSTVIRGNGPAIALKRNANGFIIEQVLPDGSVVHYAYDSVNNLISAANNECTLGFERDAVGRVVRETLGDSTVSTRFDRLGKIVGTTTSVGLEVGYVRDENSQLIRLVAGTHTIDIVRDSQGQETHRLFSNRLWLERERDSMGNLAQQRVGRGLPPWTRSTNSPTILARRYAYDPARELRVVEDSRWGRTTYGYDSTRRIRQITRDGASNEHFAYDAAGNLTEWTQETDGGHGAAIETFAYGRGVLLSKGDTSYFYDEHGRLTRKVENADTPTEREWHFTWDWLDRLKSLRTPSGQEWRYRYDPLGRRISKEGPGVKRSYVWAGDTIVHELSGEHPDTWLFDPDGYTPLGKLQDGEFYAVISDPPGIPRELLDGNGEFAWQAGPVTWRGPIDPSGRIDCPIRFPGQWYDEESGLCYNRFRYYDPATARFISADPIGLAGGLNLYAYGPNPLGWMDPWGWSFFRGARGDSPPSFEPRPGEYKVRDGQVQPTHGVSVFDNPTSVSSKGFTPHEIDPASVPDSLRIIQRGKDPSHYEIVPKQPMTEAEYREALAQIRTVPPSPPGGDDDDTKPPQEGCD